ncbi:hypothetical protein BRPE64_ECDS01360 (plasmid) [Caballeronia insecticola]|uniref:Uncharacterized protein n=1 Tax=Caballeronia insecticola TaxID=758793 RepID=A0A060PJB5_9BURK|nr:hypothetical protein BRPE64_ECDS01360 [Caballeronia insecticola]
MDAGSMPMLPAPSSGEFPVEAVDVEARGRPHDLLFFSVQTLPIKRHGCRIFPLETKT